MSEENNTPTPSAPAIDVAAITKQAVEAATAKAEELTKSKAEALAADNAARLQQAARLLAGESLDDKPKQHALHQAFIQDPETFVERLGENIVHKAEQKRISSEQNASVARSVTAEFVNKFPDVVEDGKAEIIKGLVAAKMAEVDANGKPVHSYKDALKYGFETVVKQFGLKESEGQSSGFGLPRGGAASFGASKASKTQANADFIAGMRAKAASYRNK